MAKALSLKTYLQAKYAIARNGDYHDYLFTFFVNILAQFCIVISGILTARLLGPVGKGELTTILFIPSLMLSIGLLSLPQAVALHISRNSLDLKSVRAAGFWMSVGLGVIEAALLFPLLPIILRAQGAPVILMAKISLVYLPIAFSGFTLLGVDQGRQRFVKYNLLKHLPTFFYALLLVGLAIMKSASIPFIVMGFLFSQLIATAILVASSGRELAPPRKGDRLACGRSILRQGLIYTMPALSGIILMRADLALLIPMVSARELGLYSAALAIAMGQNVLTSSIVQVNFPKVCAVGQAECSRIISRQLRKSIAPIILIALALAASSPLIIRYLLGSSFASAQNTTFVLIAAVMMWCIGQIIDNGLRGAGLGLPSTLAYIIGLLSLLAWAALLVPKYGALGMGVAFFLAQAAATAALIVALFRFVRKLRSAP